MWTPPKCLDDLAPDDELRMQRIMDRLRLLLEEDAPQQQPRSTAVRRNAAVSGEIIVPEPA